MDTAIELFADFQTIRVPVTGRFSDGRLKVLDPPIEFPESFPGKSVFHDLNVYSTFKETFSISHVVSDAPENIKFHKTLGNDGKPKEVKPMTRTKVGRLEFNAETACSDCKCMGSLNNDTECGRKWHQRLKEPSKCAKEDSDLYLQFRKHFKIPVAKSMVMYSSLLTQYDFEIETNVKWPELSQLSNSRHQTSANPNVPQTGEFKLNKKVQINSIQFPTMVVSNPNRPVTGQRTLIIKNPTDHYVYIQPFLLGDVESKHKIENALKADYPFLDRDRNQPYSDDFGIGMPKDMFLGPGVHQTLHLGFLPKEPGTHEAVLLLRNNLTVLEPVRLIGQGVTEKLTLYNENDIFIMTMREEDLKECINADPYTKPDFFRKGLTTKIKIQNYSTLSSTIKMIRINNETCSGNGWEVLECDRKKPHEPLGKKYSVQAPTNGSNGVKEIKMRYKPDFSLLEANSTMVIETDNGNRFTFTLSARIPEKYIVRVCNFYKESKIL